MLNTQVHAFLRTKSHDTDNYIKLSPESLISVIETIPDGYQTDDVMLKSGKKLWKSQWRCPQNGNYTSYYWMMDASEKLDKKYKDQVGRPIINLEGFVVKGHVDVPVTESFMQQVHEGLLPHFFEHFEDSRQAWIAKNGGEVRKLDIPFEITPEMAHAPDRIPDKDIEKYSLRDLVKEAEVRKATEEAEALLQAAEEKISHTKPSPTKDKIISDVTHNTHGKTAMIIGATALAAIGGYLAFRHFQKPQETQKPVNQNRPEDRDTWQSRVSRQAERYNSIGR